MICHLFKIELNSNYPKVRVSIIKKILVDYSASDIWRSAGKKKGSILRGIFAQALFKLELLRVGHASPQHCVAALQAEENLLYAPLK